MASAAKTYFDQITSHADPAGLLASLVDSSPPTFETEWLDFKGSPQPGDWLKIWSKALSAFGNTEGGVLIWGIDARTDPTTKVDCAGKLRLIDDPQRLKSDLLNAQHKATDPPVSGVVIDAYEYGAEAPKGFVVCFIPESASKPIRADGEKNKPYLIRSGTSSVIPSPSLLRSLFFPQTKSKLQLAVRPTNNRGPSPTFEMWYEVVIHNAGPATAHDVRIVLRKGREVRAEKALGWVANGHPEGFAFDYQRPLHPGDSSIAFSLRHDVKAGQSYGHEHRPHRFAEMAFWFAVFSSDHELQLFTVQFDGHEMGQGEEKVAQPVAEWSH